MRSCAPIVAHAGGVSLPRMRGPRRARWRDGHVPGPCPSRCSSRAARTPRPPSPRRRRTRRRSARTAARRAARRAMASHERRVRAPPPESSTSVTGSGRKRRYASAMLRAVSAPPWPRCPRRVAPGARRGSASMKRVDVGGAEQLAPGGLRRRRGEVRMREQLVDDRVDRRPGAREPAVHVVAQLGTQRAHDARRSRRRPGRCRTRARPRQPRRRAARRSRCRCRRCSAARASASARAKSSASAIGTSGAPCPPAATSRTRKSLTTSTPSALGDHRGLADLPGRVPRLVPERLAVRADRRDVAARHARVGEHRDGGVGEPVRRGRTLSRQYSARRGAAASRASRRSRCSRRVRR